MFNFSRCQEHCITTWPSQSFQIHANFGMASKSLWTFSHPTIFWSKSHPKWDLKVSWRFLTAKPPLGINNNLNINSLQLAIIFKTLWKLVILLLFLSNVAMILVWWEMENVPPLPYDLLKCSHALLEHTLVFHHKENLGLFNVQIPIQMLTYGCLEGLSKVIYIVVTKSSICLQHYYCISSSSS